MTDRTIHILSTRPLESPLLAEAARQGISVDVRSFIETRPLTGAIPGQQLAALRHQPLTAVFTSANGVDAVLHHLGSEAGTTPPWKIYCLGFATRQLVIRYFGADALAGPADNARVPPPDASPHTGATPDSLHLPASARELAEQIIREGTTGEVYFFCGNQRREELPEKLREQGIRVNELVVYETIAIPQAAPGPWDAVLFFSPSAVHSFFQVNNLPEKTILFAIGRTTEAAIREQGNYTIITSPAPDKEALVRQAIHYFSQSEQKL